MAGPAMNLILAVVLMGMARVALAMGYMDALGILFQMAQLSLVLCFFNLLPIPPLDGSHVMRHAVGMTYETYAKLCQFGFIAVIVVINIPGVQQALRFVIDSTLDILMFCFRFP